MSNDPMNLFRKNLLTVIQNMKQDPMKSFNKGSMHEAVGYNAALHDIENLIELKMDVPVDEERCFYRIRIKTKIITKFNSFERYTDPIYVYCSKSTVNKVNKNNTKKFSTFTEALHSYQSLAGIKLGYTSIRNLPYLYLMSRWNEPIKVKEKDFVLASVELDYSMVEDPTFRFLFENVSSKDVYRYLKDMERNF